MFRGTDLAGAVTAIKWIIILMIIFAFAGGYLFNEFLVSDLPDVQEK